MASSSKRLSPEDTEEEEQEVAEERTSVVPQPKRPRLWPLYSRRVIISLSVQKFFEPLLRRVVREELQKALPNHNNFQPSPWLSIGQTHEPVKYKLQFLNNLAPVLFAGKEIKAEDKAPIRVAIKDANSDEIVTSEPWASLKVKIVALRGDFNSEGHARWSEEEFNNYVQSEREGRRPLLTGDLNIRLCNGVGCVGHATFTDNSRWTRSGKFKLGALASDARERVQEAISEAVQVKDPRGQSSQKDGPPSLEDKVFCLKEIQKDGPYHQRLMSENIDTVQDFLRSFVMDSGKLRRLLKMGKNRWEVSIAHALQCNLAGKYFSYHVPEKGILLIFNTIFELVQVKIGGQNHRVNDLSISQKKEVNDYKKLAYENAKDIRELHDRLVESFDASHPAMDIARVPGTILFDPPNFDHLPKFHGASSSPVDFQLQSYAPQNAVSSDAFQPGSDPVQDITLPEAGSYKGQVNYCKMVPSYMHNLHGTVMESPAVSLTAVDNAAVPGSCLPASLKSDYPISFPGASSTQVGLQHQSYTPQNAVSSNAFQPALDPLQYTTLPEAGSSSGQVNCSKKVLEDMHNLMIGSIDASSNQLDFQHQSFASINAPSSDEFQQKFDPQHQCTTIQIGGSLLEFDPLHQLKTIQKGGSSLGQVNYCKMVPSYMHNLHGTVIDSPAVSLTAVDNAAVPGLSIPASPKSDYSITFPGTEILTDESSSQLDFQHQFYSSVESDSVSCSALNIATTPKTILFGASSSQVGLQLQSYTPQNAVSSDAFQPALDPLQYTTLQEAGSSSGQVNCSKKVPGDMHNLMIESVGVSFTAVDVAAVPGSSLPEPLNSNHPITFPEASSNQLDFQHQSCAFIDTPSCDEYQQKFDPLLTAIQTGGSLLEFDPLHQFKTIQTGGSLLSPSERCASLSTPPGPSSNETPTIQAVHHDEAAKVVPSTLELEQWVDNLFASSPQNAEITTSACPLSPGKWVQLRVAVRLMLSFLKGSTGRGATIVNPSCRTIVSSA